MLKPTLFFCTLLLWFQLKSVSLVGDGFSFPQKSHVVSLNDMWEQLENEGRRRYVFTIYHRLSCPYCVKVRNFLANNEYVAIINIPCDSSKLGLKRWRKPILIKMKSVYVDELLNKSHFYYELLRKANKVQLPALRYRNYIMFESQDIITLIDRLIKKIISEHNVSIKVQTKTVNQKKCD